MTTESFCAAEVRLHDRDRYLTALFAEAGAREHLFALYAFNLEVAKTAEMVSEPMLGEIRLQWWRDAIAGIYAGTPRDHGVIEALGAAIRAGNLPMEPFETLIDARAADLEDAPFKTLTELERYAEATAATLIGLAARVLAPADAVPPELVRAAGIAWALNGILRALAFHAAYGRTLLPTELLQAEKVDAHDLLHGRASPGLARVVEAIHDTALVHLAVVRAGRAAVPRRAVPALLTTALTASDLSTLRGAGFDPFAAALHRPRPGRLAGLVWRGVTGRV